MTFEWTSTSWNTSDIVGSQANVRINKPGEASLAQQPAPWTAASPTLPLDFIVMPPEDTAAAHAPMTLDLLTN